jgi:Methylase involved in ubiquinone/menaquinone biosynthesis
MIKDALYRSGEYLRKNPDWHVAASPWKAHAILKMLQRNHLQPHSLCDIGCGAGEILFILQQHLDDQCQLQGYDVAPYAIDIAKKHENERLRVAVGDFHTIDHATYDIILLIDVLQHIEDCWTYLRDIHPQSAYKLLQLPLDIAAFPVMGNRVVKYYEAAGHLHFFTKDVACALLKRSGYEIVDWYYTLPPLDTTPWRAVRRQPLKLGRKVLRVLKRGIQRLPGLLCYRVAPDLAVRVFGGWRLMVLIR